MGDTVRSSFGGVTKNAAAMASAADPSGSVKAVTPHASNDLPDGVCRSLWVGGAGDVALIAQSDSVAVTIVGVPAGSVLPIRAKAVRATGTTATNIVAMY